MRTCFLLLIAFLFLQAHAGGIKYPVSAIAPELLKDAHLVKRAEDIRVEILGTNKTIVKKFYVLTVLDRQGAEMAELEEHYDKLREVRSISGWLYDAAGNELRHLKNKDVADRSAVSSISIHDDNRVKHHSFSAASYPYTVAYEVEVIYHHSLFLPAWFPQDAQYLSVEQSRFTVVSPAGYQVRYRAFNYKDAPEQTADGSKQIMQWKVARLKPVTKPFAAPTWHELTTMVYLGPSDFEIEGYKGVMNTWSDLGRFIATLNRGRDALPPNVVQEVNRLTAGITDTREKAEALYHYLQQNTRYISIQLGIGGWQPFDASFVAQKGYGDCKALSNYMYSLLKAAGIQSNYVLINAGSSLSAKHMLDDFPMNQFNHAILCVPLPNDTLWLECTNQTESPGYLGSFTGNRKALLIGADGATLVNTPRYGINENLQVRKITATLDQPTGDLTAKVWTRYGALQQDDKQQMLERVTKEELKKALSQELELTTYEIKDFKYEQKKGRLPQIEEHLDLLVSKYANISGKRLFINPNLLNRGGSSGRIIDGERELDFVFDMAYRDIDSVEIELPKGYVAEALPAPVNLKTAFGSFSSTVKLEGNKLHLVRVREQFGGRYKPSETDAINQFYAAIYKADHARVVLVKQE